MAEAEERTEGDGRCTICQATSHERVLLYGEHRGKAIWVCVTCLPRLIHGAY